MPEHFPTLADVVHCRIGSSEMLGVAATDKEVVHCRIGSSESHEAFGADAGECSLPHRQLRNLRAVPSHPL